MLLDQVTDAQIRSAQIITGVTMAAFVAAPVFGLQARRIRIAVTGLYLAAVVGFIVYTVL